MNYHHSTECGTNWPEHSAGSSDGPLFKILVVDGDRVNRNQLGSLLTIAGFAARTAGDSAEALRAVASGQYDLIVADIALPRVDGHTLVCALRISGISIPVILFSGESPDGELPPSLPGQVSAVLRRTATGREIIGATLLALGLTEHHESAPVSHAQ